MWNISLVKTKDKYKSFNINGMIVDLSIRSNKDVLNDLPLMGKELERLQQRVSCPGMEINANLDFKLSGANILRIIDKFFFKEALVSIGAYVRRDTSNCVRPNRNKIVEDFLGFVPSSHTPNIFCKAAYNEVEKMINTMKLENAIPTEASNDEISLKLVHRHNNVYDYELNNKLISVCSKGHADIKDPKRLLSMITGLGEALKSCKPEYVKQAIVEMGEKAAQDVIEILFMNEAIQFFEGIALQNSIEHRTICYPSKILKHYFGSKRQKTFRDLLDRLEPMIDSITQYLIDSTPDEVQKESPAWVLYTKRGFKNTLNFTSPYERFNAEWRQFLRGVAEPYIKSNADMANTLFNICNHLWRALEIFNTNPQIKLESITDLKRTHLVFLKSYMEQNHMSSTTQHHIMIYLRKFYRYTISLKKITRSDPFYRIKIPAAAPNTITPSATNADVIAVLEKDHQLSDCVHLVNMLALYTCARADSLCRITTDAFTQKADGNYTVRILNFKTSALSVAKGEANYTLHDIPKDLGDSIFEYIRKTEPLREQMDKPYVFVYFPKNRYRENSKRKPIVLTPNCVCGEFNRLFKPIAAENKPGISKRYSLKGLRAKGGADLFAQGNSAYTVAKKLGNTPEIAKKHYSQMTPLQNAQLYNVHYNLAFDHVLSSKNVQKTEDFATPVMFGTCNANGICQLDTDCSSCPNRTVCRK